MIQGAVIYYNDGPDLLKRCLLSLKGKVDRILAIDGRFRGFKGNSINSDDGCYEVAQQLADQVIRPTEPWINQIAKRNAIFTLENTKDFYLTLDVDEILEGSINEAALDKDFYSIDIIQNEQLLNSPVRMFRNLEGLKYFKKHSWLWLNDVLVTKDLSNPDIVKLETIKIIHNPELRPEVRQQQDADYVANRSEPTAIPLEQTPLFAKKPDKTIRVKCISGRYSGFDINCTSVELVAGQECLVTPAKAKQLLADYKEQFQIME